eukprot:TRINITY_DN34298_c0_g1_i1.p1 TRINITY_DN34298_c0_g1~~TRINITY_DN34298_c0_g1_i1.p1  ORF type:complete len:1223 (+),score=209.12 TRINITY_DN34298_c0_g1_i1:97-3765(+)
MTSSIVAPCPAVGGCAVGKVLIHLSGNTAGFSDTKTLNTEKENDSIGANSPVSSDCVTSSPAQQVKSNVKVQNGGSVLFAERPGRLEELANNRWKAPWSQEVRAASTSVCDRVHAQAKVDEVGPVDPSKSVHGFDGACERSVLCDVGRARRKGAPEDTHAEIAVGFSRTSGTLDGVGGFGANELSARDEDSIAETLAGGSQREDAARNRVVASTGASAWLPSVKGEAREPESQGGALASFTAFIPGESGGALWVDQPQLESLRRRFLLMSSALQRSNASQAELQALLERTLDQCDQLREAEAESRTRCDRLRDAEAAAKRQCDQLRTSEEEAWKQCEQLRASESEARWLNEQSQACEVEARRTCEKLRATSIESRDSETALRRQCEVLRASEAEALQKCEQLLASEADACRRCEDLRVREAEAQKRLEAALQAETAARQQLEQLKAAESEAREQCEHVRALEVDIRRKYEQLQASDAELRRARDHHHNKSCVAEQERDEFKRAAQQAQVAERSARAAERSAFQEATAWRRWLASFLDMLLRRGASGLGTIDASVSTSLSLQERQPMVHTFLAGIAEGADKPGPQPELLEQLPRAYDNLSELIAGGRLAVRWDGGVQQEDTCRTGDLSASSAAHSAAVERAIQLEKRLQQKELTVAALEHDRRVLQGEVRSLQNTVQELRGSIRVFCRVRPPKSGVGSPLAEAGIGCRVEGPQRVALRKPPGDKRHDFQFDRVFPPEAEQRCIYEEVQPLLPGILEGLHVCVFAYGQTGAGKTYTLAGGTSPKERGIQDLAVCDLLRLADARTREAGGAAVYQVWLSALEIYNDSIQDLLVDPAPASATASSVSGSSNVGGGSTSGLDIRHSREGGCSGSATELDLDPVDVSAFAGLPSPFGSMRVPGLRMKRIRELAEVESALRLINSRRHVSATSLNSHSSRSHCVLSLSMLCCAGDGDAFGKHGQNGTPACPGPRPLLSCPPGVLHIVDLAGSERTKVSQAEGLQMREANAINKSLAALADVLYALGEDSAHVPYRNSKLTYLLQEPLGGAGCKTLLFAQVSPEPTDVHETYSTLLFASRVATNVQKGQLRPSGHGVASGGSMRSRQITPPRARCEQRGGNGASSGCAGGSRSQQTPPRRHPQSVSRGSASTTAPSGARGSPGHGGRDASPRSQTSDVGFNESSILMSSPVPLHRSRSSNGGNTSSACAASSTFCAASGSSMVVPPLPSR